MTFQLICGPCVMESYDHVMLCAEQIQQATDGLDAHVIFKASFDKANRTGVSSFRGPGLEEGCRWLQAVKDEFNMAVTTDVHETHQVSALSDVVDVIQIPAMLCRQTDLLLACGRANVTVNIKKGQFVAPKDMSHAVDKVTSTGNKNVWLTERGSCFGYNNLVVDFRSFQWMKSLAPVIFDVTHSVQLPQAGLVSGGLRAFIPNLARAAVAAGVDGLFLETHPNPAEAKSDGATVWPMSQLRSLLTQCVELHHYLKSQEMVELQEEV